ncbi:MAG: hypothetical protein PHI97_10175 [Desulfobulbus sp.]|nr:hypothetical protein [Desulfobulbus sp.]
MNTTQKAMAELNRILNAQIEEVAWHDAVIRENWAGLGYGE